MRLAIFVKINNYPDLIPLDISIAEKDLSKFSFNDIVNYICTFAKISMPDSIDAEASYGLSKGGVILNSELLLIENGIKNGDIVELIVGEKNIINKKSLGMVSNDNEINEDDDQSPHADSAKEESNSSIKALDFEKNQYQPIPGKKVDFD